MSVTFRFNDNTGVRLGFFTALFVVPIVFIIIVLVLAAIATITVSAALVQWLLRVIRHRGARWRSRNTTG